MAALKPAIVVISSHVARGAVGNRVMVPLLEELGYDVWAVSTVILPFHPGQGAGRRIVPSDEDFSALLDDLAARDDASRAVAVVSGYLGSAGQAAAIARFVRQMGEISYICDPVLGDASGLYVPEAVAEAIGETLIPIASCITPNRYEHDWLTGQACKAAEDWLLSSRTLAPPMQIITSVPNNDGDGIGNLFVTRDGSEALYAWHRRFDAVPSGTGDLFTAAIGGLLHRPELNPEAALTMATIKVHRSVADSVGADDLIIHRGFENSGSVVSLKHYETDSEPTHAI